MRSCETNALICSKCQEVRRILCIWLLCGLVILGYSAFAAESPSQDSVDFLEMPIEKLMEIEVASTATLTKTKPRLVPASVTTITEADINNSGARSLFELLDIYVPNLQWIRHHWESDHMGLRGILGDSKYLLLVNGRNMNQTTHSGAMSERDIVMLGDIHHIDVIRGPGSALYGPGAISMVINIVTHSPATFEGTEITTRAGAIEEFYSTEIKHGKKFSDGDGGIFLYGGIGKYVGASADDAQQIFPHDFSSRMDVEWWDADEWPDGWGANPSNPPHLPTDGMHAGDSLPAGPAVNKDGADFRELPPVKLHLQFQRDGWDIWARYTRSGKEYLYAPGLWARPRWGYGDYIFYNYDWGAGTGTYKKVQPNGYGYQQGTLYAGYKQEIAENLSVDYAFSYDTFHFVQQRQNEIDDAFREDEYYGKTILQWQPNTQHSLAFGGEVSHQELGMDAQGWPDVDAVSQRLDPMGRWSTNMYSVLGEWQWAISDKWTSFVGGRADNHTYTDWMFSPRAVLVHTPNEKDTYKLMWSRSVRANVEEEMRANMLNIGENSDPEKLDSVELRYERKYNTNLDFAVTGFNHYNLELLGWDDTAQQVTSIGNEKEYGIEVEVIYHTPTTRLVFSHGYTKLYDFDLEPGQNTFVTAKPYGYGDDLADWSNHISKITLEQKLTEKLTLNASLRAYWGFPGTKDYDQYYPYAYPDAGRSYESTGTTYPDGVPFPAHPFIEDGWEKAYRCNLYLNLGLIYKPTKNLTLGVTGYNLLGIFDKNLNKRNYQSSTGDYRTQAPAVAFSLTCKW